MKKKYLLFFCSLFICSLNCFGAENPKKQSDTGSSKINTVENQNSKPSPAELAEESKLSGGVIDNMDSKRLELAMRQKEADADKITPDTPPKSLLHIILMYIPNRVIDLSDIATVSIGFGPEASFNLTATEYCQLGAAYGDRYFLEKGFNRQYGGGYYSGYNTSLLYWKKEQAYNDYTFGTVLPYVVLEKDSCLASDVVSPDKKPYSDGIRDFWKFGFHAGWIIDLGAAIHPTAIANFFTGFIFIRLTDTEEL